MVQVNPPFYNLRIKFNKVGDLQYISHLDLVRTMQKALKRAGLDVWYTEGFNPKPKMVFGPPLSIGVESECEFLDVRLLNKPNVEDIKERLDKALPYELSAIDVYEQSTSLSEIEWLSYEITVETKISSFELCKKLSAFFEKNEINIVKKSKRGEVLVNIRPLIKSVDIEQYQNGAKISCILASSSQSFLNPEHLIRAIKAYTDVFTENLLTESYTVLRKCAYKADMTEFK